MLKIRKKFIQQLHLLEHPLKMMTNGCNGSCTTVMSVLYSKLGVPNLVPEFVLPTLIPELYV